MSLPEEILIAYSNSRKWKFGLVGDLDTDRLGIAEVDDEARDHEGEE